MLSQANPTGSIPLPTPKRVLCCLRPDGQFARVWVGNFGPTYVWWILQPASGTNLTTLIALGKAIGDEFWASVARADDVQTFDSREEVAAEAPNLPLQFVDLDATESFR